MKIFIGALVTETNTFAPAPTGLAGYQISRSMGDNSAGEHVAWNEVLARMSRDTGVEIARGLIAFAQPSGTTLRSAYEALRDELLDQLCAALPVNAVLLPLHGAMVAEGYPDCEGDLIERVRNIVGSAVPIGVELDLHCHFTEQMRTHADIIVAYKEYPHTDVLERFEELWTLTLQLVHGRIRPVTAVFDCRMVSLWHTTREPMQSFVQRMKDLEREPGVLSVSFGHGFPWGDVPEAGAKVWVVTDGDAALAQRLAEQLGREIWEMRASSGARQWALSDALDRVQAAPAGQPIVIADIADNAGGGAMSDSTFVLQGVIERGIGNVALGAFFDLGAIQICREAGVGAQLQLRVGGKCGPASGLPLDLRVTVRAIREEHFQSDLSGVSALGPSAWVATDDGIDIVLVTRRQQVFSADLFTGLGIALAAKRLIVVKSSQHFHAAFAPLASEVLYVETPGLLRADYENIPYRHRDLGYWPRVANPWATAA